MADIRFSSNELEEIAKETPDFKTLIDSSIM